MLGLYAAETGARISFTRKLVISAPDHACAAHWRALGYRVIANEDAALGQAKSVRLAAAHATEAGASALCVMLADMPFVTVDHIGRLIANFQQSDGRRTVASVQDGQAMPPAIFPAAALPSLLALEGDRGARTLLADAEPVEAKDPVLIDIDTVEDLAQANEILARSQ